ncbi:hypothetical protein V8P79_08575 [Acinetobacter baumannii]
MNKLLLMGSLLLVSSPIFAYDNNNCYGTSYSDSCSDSNSRNNYSITKYGNTTEVEGSNYQTGSRWNQSTYDYGNGMTSTTGHDKNGNSWSIDTQKVGDTTYYNGRDSEGKSFSYSCDSYYGCTKPSRY